MDTAQGAGVGHGRDAGSGTVDWLAASDADLVGRLRAGDEAAFASVFTSLDARLRGMCRMIVRSETLAEEAAQETWLAVITGLPQFEGRSALATWIYSIALNKARSIVRRERRDAAPSLALAPADDSDDLTGSPGDLEGDSEFDERGRWREQPASWGLEDPESVFLRKECQGVIERALAQLPETQRLAVLLGDVQGLPSGEVCNILGVSESNQRVLVHRGRRAIRAALDAYLRGEIAAPPPNAAKTRDPTC